MLCLASLPTRAQEDPLQWLPPGSLVETTLSERPARWIRSEMQGGRMGYLARLGELAFRSPLTLGRDAARKGLSCDACHPNGAANNDFFVPGASDRPGNVDVTHLQFNFREDDGIANPLNIPSLRGVRLTAPYGRDGRFTDLRSFSRNVIMNEFGGPDPDSWLLDALNAYMRQLALPPNTQISRIDAPAAYDRHCAACHGAAASVVQGHRYDVGTGDFYEAPGLRGLAETAPYMHDGSAATVREAILAHIDTTLGEPASASDLTLILSYLEALGAVDRRFDPETLDSEVQRLVGFLEIVRQPLLDENATRASTIGDMVAMEIGRIYGRYDEQAGQAKTIIRDWAGSLKQLIAKAGNGDFPAARDDLTLLQRTITEDLPQLRTQIDLSLFAATEPD